MKKSVLRKITAVFMFAVFFFLIDGNGIAVHGAEPVVVVLDPGHGGENLGAEYGEYTEKDIDVLFSGDLLNQIISASFAARDFNFPFLGLYSACSTMSESLLLGAMLVNAGYVNRVVAATGSHFASAERQYRYPLGLGCTRPPQAQWTVTAAGGCVISSEKKGVKIVNGTMGKVCDFGVTDVNNMGAAMAPAVAIIGP